jgi:hypothetical protein
MKTKVIDIRQHPIEKVIAYLVSQGGINRGLGRDKRDFPYVGIDQTNTITGWSEFETYLELIDLPKDLLVADLLIADLESVESKHRKDLADTQGICIKYTGRAVPTPIESKKIKAHPPEEEFKTGDRVVDGVGSKGYFIGTLNGIHYYIADDIPYVCSTQTTTIKHHKEPELFEGWVHSLDKCHVYKTNVDASMVSSLGRVFPVREVKP